MKDKLRIVFSVVIVAAMLGLAVLAVADAQRIRGAYTSAQGYAQSLADTPKVSGVRLWLYSLSPNLFAKCQPTAPAEWEYELLSDGCACITKYNGRQTELVIPSELDGHSVTVIGDHAFAQRSTDHEIDVNSTLETLVVPEGVVSIGDHAFKLCEKLRKVTLPEGLRTIGGGAFSYCQQLKDINIPSTVESIGVSALYYCTALKSIRLPDSMTQISDNLFGDCWQLSDIRLPEGLTSIGYGAFFRCYELKSLTLPQSVTTVSDAAFADCTSLEKLTVTRGDTKLGLDLFAGANSEIVLCAPKSSAVQRYAEENGMSFEAYVSEQRNE